MYIYVHTYVYICIYIYICMYACMYVTDNDSNWVCKLPKSAIVLPDWKQCRNICIHIWAFLKITEVAQIWGHCYTGKEMNKLILTKMGLHFAFVFKNSSGPNPTTSMYNATNPEIFYFNSLLAVSIYVYKCLNILGELHYYYINIIEISSVSLPKWNNTEFSTRQIFLWKCLIIGMKNFARTFVCTNKSLNWYWVGSRSNSGFNKIKLNFKEFV
jgi:hypothetical protein